LAPEVVCKTAAETVSESASKILAALERGGYIPSSAEQAAAV
jgi:hypothetical protein